MVTVLSALIFLFSFSPFILLCAAMPEGGSAQRIAGGLLLVYLGIVYIGFSLLTLVFLRMMPAGWFFVLFTFFVVWAGDTFAYYVGRAFGRIPFAPRISPKKTWEGAAGFGRRVGDLCASADPVRNSHCHRADASCTCSLRR